ncbi:hypothetical protein HUU62_08810 [Rhodoferax sp. 4810]|uniref:Uncharacterized protein n=1 Tax=Thiospirillum jenense TaxID=1653858 RepID=A0A839HDP4_9GAMM|nr:hypothetical protein [Thiospirillum jenense]MBB1074510.1 hypothetical protein [Rhodoferax jenense]MBB1125506.1 hypothetical protein [Thiospirillum jenense]
MNKLTAINAIGNAAQRENRLFTNEEITALCLLAMLESEKEEEEDFIEPDDNEYVYSPAAGGGFYY